MRALLVGLTVSLSACAATLPGSMPGGTHAQQDESPSAQCEARFAALNGALEAQGLRDAEAQPIAGFPHLRSSRLLRSYIHEMPLPSMWQSWLQRARALDQQARKFEIANLGTHVAAPLLGYAPDTALEYLLAALHRCGDLLLERDLDRVSAHAQLSSALRPEPSSFNSPALQYQPTVRAPAGALARAFAQSLETPPPLRQTRARLAPQTRNHSLSVIAKLVASRRLDALGLPILSQDVQRRLIEAFAPVVEVLQESPGGAPPSRVILRGSQQSPEPALDRGTPALYTRLDLSRHQNSATIQLTYGAWLGNASNDIHGLLYLRVTLNRRGEPVFFDAMAGHGIDMFRVPIGRAASTNPWRQQSYTLPPMLAEQRLRVTIDADGLTIHGLDYVPNDVHGTPYTLIPDAILRSLPVDNDARRRASLYDNHARARSSSGGANADARSIRQWGHHELDAPSPEFRAHVYFDSPQHRDLGFADR